MARSRGPGVLHPRGDSVGSGSIHKCLATVSPELAQWSADTDEDVSIRAYAKLRNAERTVASVPTQAVPSAATPSDRRATRRGLLFDLGAASVVIAVAVITGWICFRLAHSPGGL